jgi:hypothetical protein
MTGTSLGMGPAEPGTCSAFQCTDQMECSAVTEVCCLTAGLHLVCVHTCACCVSLPDGHLWTCTGVLHNQESAAKGAHVLDTHVFTAAAHTHNALAAGPRYAATALTCLGALAALFAAGVASGAAAEQAPAHKALGATGVHGQGG